MITETHTEQHPYRREHDVAVLRAEFDSYRELVTQHREFEIEMLTSLRDTVNKLGHDHAEDAKWRHKTQGALSIIKWVVALAAPALLAITS